MQNPPSDLLPADVLSQRNQLPEKPDHIKLSGSFVKLEPLVVERDALELFALSNGKPIRRGYCSIDSYDSDELIWRYMSDGPFETFNDLSVSLQPQVDAPNGLCLCVFNQKANQPIGIANFMNNVPSHLKIELGGIWYSPIAQRTSANMEATYLMLNHAFKLGYRRVEWKCNAENERSRKAALRMGFKFEGIQESHMIIKNRNRDTAWFRILAHEWSEVKTHLEKLLYGACQ